MSRESGKRWLISGARGSELQHYAQWFHHDWKLMFNSFTEGTEMYLRSITADRRRVLGAEFAAFLSAHADRSESRLKASWYELGAQAWEPGVPVRSGLEGLLSKVSTESN